MTFLIDKASEYCSTTKSKRIIRGHYFMVCSDHGQYEKLGDAGENSDYVSLSRKGWYIHPKLKDLNDIKLPINLKELHPEMKVSMKHTNYENRYPAIMDWVIDKKFDMTGIDFICSKSILTTIGSTVYDFKNRTPWQYRICKYNGVCYITCYPVASHDHEQHSYWDMAFQKQVTDDECVLINNSVKLQENSVYCHATEGSIGNFRFLYHSESSSVNSLRKRVDLKTAHYHGKDGTNQLDFRKNLCEAWLQAYFGLSEKVLYGLQNNKGDVENLKEYNRNDILQTCIKEWKPAIMIGFLSKVLSWALPYVQEKQSSLITFDGKKSISLTQKDGFYFPEDYIEYADKFPCHINSAKQFFTKLDESLIIWEPEAYSRKVTYFHTQEIGHYINLHTKRDGIFTEMPTYVAYDSGAPLYPTMKEICTLQLPINLGKKYVKPSESWECLADEEHVDFTHFYPSVCNWISDETFDINQVDFVCNSSMLKNIGLTLYCSDALEWTYRICKYNGICYTQQYVTKNVVPEQMASYHAQASFWGIAFEDIVTTKPTLPEELSHIKSPENMCYYSVTLNRIGKHKFLSSSEIDAIDPHSNKKIELKTAQDPGGQAKYEKMLRDKFACTWLQSYLGGVDKVIYGLRDYKGVVSRLKEYDTVSLPLICSNEWSSVAIMRFIETVLDWTLPQIEEGKSYILRKPAGINLIKITEKDGFYLPEKYLSEMNIKVDKEGEYSEHADSDSDPDLDTLFYGKDSDSDPELYDK